MNNSHCHCGNKVFENTGKCIFHCDKTDWYEDLPDGTRSWNNAERKVIPIWHNEEHFDTRRSEEELEEMNYKNKNVNAIEYFWLKIQEKKVSNYDYDFSEYVFPKFQDKEGTFGGNEESGIKKTILGEKHSQDCIFRDSQFLGYAEFFNFEFHGRVDFSRAKFFYGATFEDSIFKSDVYFGNATIYSDFNFYSLEISTHVDFSHSRFKGQSVFGMYSGLPEIDFLSTIFEEKSHTSFVHIKVLRENLKYRFQGTGFYGITLFKNCDLSQTSFLNSDIENIDFEECNFWKIGEEKKIFDELELERKIEETRDDPEKVTWRDYKQVEKIYTRLQKNFAQDNEISESEEFALANVSLAQKRIKLKYSSPSEQEIEKKKIYDSMIRVYAKIKKEYDDLSLYSEGDKFYGKEFEERTKKEGGWYHFYKWFSDYNNSPTRIILWIIGSILVFTAWYGLYIHSFLFSVGIAFLLCTFFIYIFWKNKYKQLFLYSCCFLGIGVSILAILFAIFHDLNNVTFSLEKILNYTISNNQLSFLEALEYSFTSTIPLLSSSEEISKNMDFGFRSIHYFQMIFSTILWALLILTFRRKFKRGGE